MTDTYYPRDLARLAGEALQTVPVLVVTGLRQSGKTTFIERDPLFAGFRRLSLDDLAILEAARRDPAGLISGSEPLIVDEVQRCPELLPAIKQAVDRKRRPGRFVLSGSANLALLSGVGESLAGRSLYLTLHPFARRERSLKRDSLPFLVRLLQEGLPRQRRSVAPLAEVDVLTGGFPPLVLGETKRRDLWLRGYEQTYLERDVRNLAQVADLVAYRNLARLCALRTAQLLRQSELARDARLPATTVGRYLGLLETSFVIARLPPFLKNRTTRLLKSPKLFVGDSGLCAHLAGVADLRPEADEMLRGALFETYVFQNLAALIEAHLDQADLAFWHVQGRHEVDFVISLGRQVVAIEVKAGSAIADSDLVGLRAFAGTTPGFAMGLLAYNGSELLSLGDGLYAVPLGLLLS